MTKTETPDRAYALSNPPTLALQKAAKGSHRSMWEILLQLRVLLPYLSHLAPLLDRGLRTAPDFTELNSGIASIQNGHRELEVQARNQALQLEHIGQQMARLRVFHEKSTEENRKLVAAVEALRQWIFIMAVVMIVTLGGTAVMVAFLLLRA